LKGKLYKYHPPSKNSEKLNKMEREVKSVEESKELIYLFLSKLPGRILLSFARKYKNKFKLRVFNSKEKLISQILEKVPKKIIIQELYSLYGEAGNITVHLFRVKNSMLNNISSQTELSELLKNSNLTLEGDISESPNPVKIEFIDNKIRMRFEFLGEPITYLDPLTRIIQTVKPLRTSFLVMNPKNGIAGVRVSERKYALEMIKLLTKYFGGEYEKIHFTREDIAKWIDQALTLRNVRFKPIVDISTLYMSAKVEKDLRDSETFKQWWNKRERVGGIYIQFNYRGNEKIGFGINAWDGKIMFRTFVGEEEIEYVINQACKILGIENE